MNTRDSKAPADKTWAISENPILTTFPVSRSTFEFETADMSVFTAVT